MKTYDNLDELLGSFSKDQMTEKIVNAFVIAWPKIHGHKGVDGSFEAYTKYPVINVSISGGADSDIMLDMIERIGYPLSEVRYHFFDTGLEFKATKEHLEFLEKRYGITIERHRAKVPVPIGVKKYGYPFLSKRVSEYIERLQKHGFKWEDRPFEELYAEYPHCKAALRWWCNAWGEGSKMGIDHQPYLKDFLIANPPEIPISPRCCDGAKKAKAHELEKEADLNCVGVRKAEGGARSTGYHNCFTEYTADADQFRPIFWFENEDKEAYEAAFFVIHSDCYTLYGLKRTGCACCPFGKRFEDELQAAEIFEPQLYLAATNVFGPSYDYTRKYRAFVAEQKARKK